MDLAMLLFAIVLIFFLPINVLSQLSPNVTLGSSLTANDGKDSWISPSGEFSFGFIQSPGGTGAGYLLAIWFNKIPEKTVIWSANRDNLVPEGSRLQLFEDGRFVLNDPRGNNIWDANTSSTGVAYGVMLDTGNFVLVSNTSQTLWQSFDTPTDTLLPSQKLLTEHHVIPSLTATNYSSGRFELRMQSDGNLVLYTRNYPLPYQHIPYWSTTTFGDDFELFFSQSGPIIILAKTNRSEYYGVTTVFSNVVSSDQYYQRLTLDYDGVLRHYVYPRSSRSTGGSPMAWSVFEFLPSDICLSINQPNSDGQPTGGGLCGYNSLCSSGNDTKPVCKCPAGYLLVVPNDSLSGCKTDFVPQSCDNNLNETGDFGYKEMLNTDWPLTDSIQFQRVSEDWCRQVCLGDCSCPGVTFDNGNCSILKPPFSNGRTDASLRGTAFIKVRNPPPDPGKSTIKNKKSRKSLTIIIVVCLIATLLFLTLSLYAFIARRRRQKAKTGLEEDEEELPVGTTQYDFASVRAATEDFSTANMLGSGGFGAVYKGVLADGKEIAVKRLSTTSSQGEKEFRNEVKLLAKLQHNCLVRLLGFCLERAERLLIYEFMKNGSLDKILFDPEHQSRLDWESRYRIIKSIARGLLYLHEDSHLMIIHRDLKAGNILLDEEMNAKISDFGLARLFVRDDSQVITKRIAGTLGYMSPEYAMHGLFSVKSDVYSYGVLLLEIVSGKRNYYSLNEDTVEGLISYAYKAWKEGKASDLIDPVVRALDPHSLETVMRCIHIALLCVQDNVGGRPTMATVVGMLQSLTVTLPTPFEPGFFNKNSSWLSELLHTAAHNDPPGLQEETDSYLYPR